MVRIVAGAHRVDMAATENRHCRFHVCCADSAAPLRVPFVAVHAVQHEPFAVQAHDPAAQLETPESRLIWYHFRDHAIRGAQTQRHLIQLG